MDVLQTNIISIQSDLQPGLQQLLQVTNRLIDINVLSDEITCCDGLLLYAVDTTRINITTEMHNQHSFIPIHKSMHTVYIT